MLKLSGVPVLVRDQAKFSQLMRAWLNKVRSSPAPDLAVVQRQHDDRQAFEASREHACRINLEAAEQAQYRKDINTLAQGADGRQAPEKPPVAWVARKVLKQKLGPFFPALHSFLSNLLEVPDDKRSKFARKPGKRWEFDLDALVQHLLTEGKLYKAPDFDTAPECAASLSLVEKHTRRYSSK